MQRGAGPHLSGSVANNTSGGITSALSKRSPMDAPTAGHQKPYQRRLRPLCDAALERGLEPALASSWPYSAVHVMMPTSPKWLSKK